MTNLTPVSLAALFAEFPFTLLSGKPDSRPVSGIVADSRAVRPGNVFVAVSGGSSDGHRFIANAIAAGAAAVVGEQAIEGLAVPYIRVQNTRQSLAHLAAAFEGYPGRKLTMIGVTGTDGKTTTCSLIYQILLAAGIRAGMISTVNAVIGDKVLDTGFHVTTPDAPDVQRYLGLMAEAGLTHVILETTSHGWAQHRVDACEFDIGVVTNISHEHLDYHGTYDQYRAAKARLFTSLADTRSKPRGNIRLAVLNWDDISYEYLRDLSQVRQITYGLGEGADIRATDIAHQADGIQFLAEGVGLRVSIRSQLLGSYNISNCLAALAVCTSGLEMESEVAARGIAALHGVPGRMERIEMGQDFEAIVDFAHTPNALKNALLAAGDILKTGPKDDGGPAAKPRVIAVFGSAGLRDREKRRMMAEVSAELADLTVLTAEDPRSESLVGILDEMAEGARSKGGVEGVTFWRVPDRGEAIRFAVHLARRGDVVLACGKGHEQSMCFGTQEYLWDDRTAMRAALAELLRVEGPAMPYLPSRDTSEKEWLS